MIERVKTPNKNVEKNKAKKKFKSFIKGVKENKFAYKLILPALIAMVVVHLIPIASGIMMSFLKLNQFTLKEFLNAPFIGFDNYKTVLFDSTSTIRSGFFDAFRNTVVFSILCSILVLTLGMILALLLNRDIRFRGLARTLLMTPWIVPSFVVGMLWGFMWQQDGGIINRLLVDVFHILPDKPFWLTGPKVMIAIIIPTIWRCFPFVMLMLLAGLQNIPEEYYEAAEVDGANAIQKFWMITVPLLKPVIAIQVLNGMINYIYSFNIVAMMFGHGAGFPGKYGDLLMTNINRNSFGIWQFGTGAAATVIVMICVLSLVAVWYKIFNDDLVVND